MKQKRFIQKTKWLDSLNITKRQHRVVIDDKLLIVDGYDAKTNTIYEFYEDFLHGNPRVYKETDLNKVKKKTFGILYQETINRIKLFYNNGYKVVYIWENEFKKIL